MSTQIPVKVSDDKMYNLPLRKQLLNNLPVNEHTVSTKGFSTFYLEGGKGLPVILLHGPGETSVWWMRVLPELVKKYKMIIPDLPGHGKSEIYQYTFSYQHIIDWLDEFIRKTCTGASPVLVGHILGGAIAARYAIKNPDRVDQLILVDTFGLSKFRLSSQFAFGLIRFMSKPNEKNYNRFQKQCMYDPDKLSVQMGEKWKTFREYNLDNIKNPQARSILRNYIKEFGMQKIPDQELETITKPTNLIWGRYDKALKLKIAGRAAEQFGWPLHIIDNTRDDPKLEQPEAFNKILNNILANGSGLN